MSSTHDQDQLQRLRSVQETASHLTGENETKLSSTVFSDRLNTYHDRPKLSGLAMDYNTQEFFDADKNNGPLIAPGILQRD